MTKDATPATTDDATVALRRKAYTMAGTALREAHPEEFKDLYIKAGADLGVQITLRQTPEEKAAADFDALLEQYPDLARRVPGATAPTVEP